MKPVVFHRAARQELDNAALWYEERRVDLGIEFIAEIDRCIDLLARHEHFAPIVFQDVRRMPVKRFPYSIYYRQDATHIAILAIFHGKRNPEICKRRV